jgi:hypothetical protein
VNHIRLIIARGGYCANVAVLSITPFFEAHQQHAFYSANPKNHEQARNGRANCKTMASDLLQRWIKARNMP